jgi:hypothetical protein
MQCEAGWDYMVASAKEKYWTKQKLTNYSLQKRTMFSRQQPTRTRDGEKEHGK